MRSYVRPIDADGPFGFRLICESRFLALFLALTCLFVNGSLVAQVRRHFFLGEVVAFFGIKAVGFGFVVGSSYFLFSCEEYRV